MHTRLAVTSIALTLLAACGDGYGSKSPTQPGTTTGTNTNAVSVADNSYTPATASVAAGTTVTWTWAGSNQHDVTFDDGTKSAIQRAGTYQRTFAAAGTFPYHCSIHGASMAGTVTVR